ncbi:hypothetical protein [Niveibacterium sp. SC-1]|uniref:hypothetical protein n=1 Tax=Niveibacterium sp. SC-1 TaxID=3135646 RepID=UPI00311E3238
MLIFLDTEFTDFIDCDLISIGMVSEDSKYEFYAERNDFRQDWENPFVKDAVVPLLGEFPSAACSRSELTQRLSAWFAGLPRHVQLACDSVQDRDLLWDAFEDGLPKNLDTRIFDLRPLIDTTLYHQAVCRHHERPGCPWHHALHDARAHRAGWMAWMDAQKSKGRG